MNTISEWNKSANERALKSIRSWRLWIGFPFALIIAFPFYWGGDLLSWLIFMLAYCFFLVQVPERKWFRFLVIAVLLIAAIASVEIDKGNDERSNSALHPTKYRFAVFVG